MKTKEWPHLEIWAKARRAGGREEEGGSVLLSTEMIIYSLL